jgi:hypothetical protein
MPSKKPSPRSTSRFNVDLFVDVVAAGCILVIAGRPDALAITLTAVILAVVAMVCRATMGVKAYLSGSGGDQDVAPRAAPAPAPPPAATESASARADRASWLRE